MHCELAVKNLILYGVLAIILTNGCSNGGSGDSFTPAQMEVNFIVIDPQTTTTIYTASDDGKGMWKSLDSGLTWAEINNKLCDMNIRGISLLPANSTTLFATTSYAGIFKSTTRKTIATTTTTTTTTRRTLE